MMKDSMIAPCGLNCSLCSRALQKESPCLGCLGPDECKHEFCRDRCKIAKCEARKALPDRFCDSCERFPCEDVMEKETRYTSDYPMIESPIGNLFYMRKHGMDALIEREKRRWLCPDCGEIVCVSTGVCSGCGREFDMRVLK